MKITGTRSYILVEAEGRTYRIDGELTSAPAFYADKESIRAVDPQGDAFELSEGEKDQLIRQIIRETGQDGKVPVRFG